MIEPMMIATCWTSCGAVAPMDPDERSPHSLRERIAALTKAGWGGIGIAQDDLREIHDTIGFAEARRLIEDAGLQHVEVELLTDWWEDGERRDTSDRVRALLLEAAEVLGAAHIKIASTYGPAAPSLEPFAAPLLELSRQAADAGTRLAIEGMPFSLISSVPRAAELAQLVDHPACGVIVDSWHVFRAGTSLEELFASLTPEILVGVELDDAATDVVGSLFDDTIHRRLLCGRGSFDLVGLVRGMRDFGWSGGWGVEIISEDFRRLPLDEAVTLAFDTGRDVVRAGLAS